MVVVMRCCLSNLAVWCIANTSFGDSFGLLLSAVTIMLL